MTDAEKRKKVIRGLECCLSPNDHENCPYDGIGKTYSHCLKQLVTDAFDLLREQEVRVMDAEEVARLTEETYQWLWIEEIQNITWNLHCLRAFVYSKHPDTGEFYILANGYRDIVKLEGDEYGKTWRCWSAKPTPEQMRDTPWEADICDGSG